LLTVARDFDERQHSAGQLEAFLEETSLVNDTDAWETEVDRVTLMTLHASKGLEFPVVYLTAVEEGLLPHERSRERPEQLEEERRLLFVGITRAQQELQISLARSRDFRGQRKVTIPSSFLMELPRGEMDIVLPEMQRAGAMTYEWGEADSLGFDDADHSQLVPEEQWHDEADDSAASSDVDQQQKHDVPADILSRLGSIRLTTAAALANGGQSAPAVDPNVFRQSMRVLHPTFGLGQIIALSGSGAGRKAMVEFSPPLGRKSILLADGLLRPLGT